MLTVRKSEARGYADHGWLKSYHSFSFANYYDPAFMGFRALRVINHDKILGGGGFPTHPHQDMEIVTYLLSGALAHKDSLGNGSIIATGDVQRMTAGTGIRHSEFNASQTETAELLQIWLLPSVNGLPPGYEQKHFSPTDKLNKLRLVASGDGAEGSVKINQDARIYSSLLEPDQQVAYALAAGRYGWLQVARGALQITGSTGETHSLDGGDAVAVHALTDGTAQTITLTGKPDQGTTTEILWFDLP
ncbi:MAG: pirin family protein [Pseudanabaenaceae cyanobacterium]|jgi:hypothetical protein